MPNARSARRIPSAMSIHPGSYAIHALLAANRPKALPRRAAASVTLEFWTIRVGALPCFASALSTWEKIHVGCVWPCFPPKKLFDFSRVKLKKCSIVLKHQFWSKVRKCGCPKDEAKSSDTCVKCHDLFLNCSKPGAEIHSASPLPNYTRLGNESRAYKCLPPASRCNANLSDPLSQVKGVSNEGFCCPYINVSIFCYFMDSLEHLHYLLLNDTCDL